MIDWTQQPRDRGVLACSWHSDASVLHDVSPRSCDVTAAVYDAAGADLCVNLVGVLINNNNKNRAFFLFSPNFTTDAWGGSLPSRVF